MKVFTKIYDPGHGWLKVSRKAYEASGYVASRYSYQSASGKTVYLEEDCDMYGFLLAIGYSTLTRVRLKNVYIKNYSKIRNLEPIK